MQLTRNPEISRASSARMFCPPQPDDISFQLYPFKDIVERFFADDRSRGAGEFNSQTWFHRRLTSRTTLFHFIPKKKNRVRLTKAKCQEKKFHPFESGRFEVGRKENKHRIGSLNLLDSYLHSWCVISFLEVRVWRWLGCFFVRLRLAWWFYWAGFLFHSPARWFLVTDF